MRLQLFAFGFATATREAYWSTFNEGRITESSISVLMESIDEAIDLTTQGLHDWNYISTRLKFPGYYKFFSTSVVCAKEIISYLLCIYPCSQNRKTASS